MRSSPGPGSRKRRAPAARMARSVSRQRTGWSGPRRGGTGTSSKGARGTQEKTGALPACCSGVSRASPKPGTAGAIAASGRRRRPAGGSPRSPAALGLLLAFAERLGGAGEDDLAGRVVVGDGQLGAPASTPATSRPPRSGEHPAVRPLGGLLHQAAADDRQAQAVVARSSAPPATSAASSPSEWPAKKRRRRAAGRSSGRGRRRRAPAGRSGCPRRSRSKGSAPSSSAPARAGRGARRATAAMPCVWLPWPGKRIAVSAAAIATRRILVRPAAAGDAPGRADPPDRGACRGVRRRGRQTRIFRRCAWRVGLGPVADAELAVDRAGVLLDRVRREVQVAGDLFVGRAGGDQREDLLLALGERRVERRVWSAKTSCPSETMRTALTTSTADQSLEMKPEAPAERATWARSRRRRRSAAPGCAG